MKRFLPYLIGSIIVIIFLGSFFLLSKKSDNRKAILAEGQVCPGQPIETIILIDNSDSMKNKTSDGVRKIAAAKQAAKQYVNLIADGKNEVGIVWFAKRGGIQTNLTKNKNQLISGIDNLKADQPKGTCIECGLIKANEEMIKRRGNGNRKIFIILTDGKTQMYDKDDNVRLVIPITRSSFDKSERQSLAGADIIDRNFDIDGGAIFYTVGVGKDANNSFLREIAEVGDGQFFFAEKAGELQNSFIQIADLVKSLLGYFSIFGLVYEDKVKDGNYTLQDKPLENVTLRISGNGNYSYVTKTGIGSNAGKFSFQGLCSSTYKVLAEPVAGYSYSSPSTINPAYQVTFNQNASCSVTPLGKTACTSGQARNLNYTLHQSVPPTVTITSSPPPTPSSSPPGNDTTSWIQVHGLDVRFEKGLINKIPENPVCEGVLLKDYALSSEGILFSGNRNIDTGKGKVSNFEWKAGGFLYPDVLTGSDGEPALSYASIEKKIMKSTNSRTNLATVCNLSNCTLTVSLPSGIYYADRDVTLRSFTAANGKKYIFLIGGKMTISGEIFIPKSTFALFSSSGDIVVSENVGRAPACLGNDSQLDGMFVTNTNFIIQSKANCPVSDEQLVLHGGIAVNGKRGNGQFINNRTLCAANNNYPSFMLQARPDMLLAFPDVIKAQSVTWRESSP